MKYQYAFIIAIFLAFTGKRLSGQDLDPRAYAWVPVKVTVIGAGFSYSDGGVVTDATLPVKDLNAKIGAPSLFAVRSFRLLGRTAQASAALPYAWGEATAIVAGEQQSVNRSGLGDMRLRFAWLIHGAPAATLGEIAKAPRKTILGISMGITAPTGQYFPEKLLNLGTSRWAFKTELGLSQPVGKKWLIDFYSGIWLFTKNNAYYPGNSIRTQHPLQFHFWRCSAGIPFIPQIGDLKIKGDFLLQIECCILFLISILFVPVFNVISFRKTD